MTRTADVRADPPKLAEIAERLTAHLKRMEAAQPAPLARRPFYLPQEWVAGPRVGVRYISYQYSWYLTKADALQYLLWLDAGNTGRHARALHRPAEMEAAP